MAFYINTNVASLQAQDYLNQTQANQNQTIQEVTSGLRIVNSGDDAAGLAIANGYRSDEAVLTQGIQNANDGLSQLQIADGGISNISQLLDRARTLATESASGTFTGNRGVLNSEFQSVVTEINRQAQAIGLNQGGTFAKTLTTFIGGGQASNGVTATQNGTISLDLGSSTVDAASLGLSGVQAAGAATTDIGPGSAATSMASILSNAANTGSEATPGYTTFTVKGAGFGSGVTLSVNTANLGSTSDLVAAVNSAITAASNNGTQQGTALLNANISASINTDASGGQQLAFNSSNAAFQVQAGDKVSNALLGNFAQNSTITGTDSNATVTLGSTQSLAVTFNGAASPVSVSLTAGTYSKADIVKALNANAGFSAAGTASLQGNQITIQSNSNSSTSSVGVTAGTLATDLGLSSTTATAANASTGASLTTQVTAGNNTAAGSTTFGATGAGTITLQFQGAGQTTPTSVSITTTATENVTQAIAALNTAVSTNAALETAGISLSTSTAGNALTFSSTSGQQFSVGATGDAQNLLGLGSFNAGANGAYDYNTLGGTSYNSATAAGTDNFEISLGGGASNAAPIAVDLTAGDATAAATTATDTTATPLTVTANNNTLNLSVNGTSFTVNLSVGGSETKSSIANQINTVIGAQGTATVNSNNQLVITSNTKGAGGSVQIQSGGSDAANTLLGLAAAGPVSGTSRSGASVAQALNTGFAANSSFEAAGLQATFSAGAITISSANSTYFRANSYGSATSATAVGSTPQGTAATAGSTTGSTTTATIVTGTNDDFNININGGGAQDIFLAGGGGAQTLTQVAAELNTNPLMAGVTAGVDSSGHLTLTDNTTGAAANFALTAGTNSALATLGLTAGTYSGTAAAAGYNVGASNNQVSISVNGGSAQVITLTNGANRTATQVEGDLNTYFTANNIAATASVNNGALQVTSNTTGANSSIVFNATPNSAYASLGLTAATTYSGTSANTGFGVSGATFTGNVSTSAPVASPTIDSGGASATSSLSFTPILTGSGQQTITISAQDSSGNQQSLAVNLSNNATSRNGESIDQAVSAINTTLQQSNNSTLNQIVAVKDDSSGTEKISFMSTLNSFQVSVGTTAQGTGVGSQGTTAASAVSAGGSTAEIADISGANAAVNALANAVTALGNAQAVVGRGENQFNYAINLAQSQLTNTTSAEATLRDADLATESGNLTKTQIQLQAGIAALAQANSAPQQLLKLLQ